MKNYFSNTKKIKLTIGCFGILYSDINCVVVAGNNCAERYKLLLLVSWDSEALNGDNGVVVFA